MTQSRDWPYDENYRLKSGLPNEDSSIFDNVDVLNTDETYTSQRKDSRIESDISIPIDSVAAANFTKNVENRQLIVDSQELREAVSDTIDNIFNEEILDLSEIKHPGEQRETLRPFARPVIKQSVKVEKDDRRTLKLLSPESSNHQDTKLVPEEIPYLSDEESFETGKQSNASKTDEEKSASIECANKQQKSSIKGRDPRKFGMERSRKDVSIKGESSKRQDKTEKNVAKSSFRSSPRRTSAVNYNQNSPRKRLGPVDEATTSSRSTQRGSELKSISKQRSSKSPQKRTPAQSSRVQPSSVRPVKSTPPGPSKTSGTPRTPKSRHPLSAAPAMKTNKETTAQIGTRGSRKILTGVPQKQQRGKKLAPTYPSKKGKLNSKRTSKECPQNDKNVEERENRQSPIGCEIVSPTAKKPNETSSVAEQKQESPARTLEIIPAESKEGKLDYLTVSLSQTSVSSLGGLYGSSASGKVSRNSDMMLKLTSSEESISRDTTHISGVFRNLLKI